MVAHKFHKLNCSSVYVLMLYQTPDTGLYELSWEKGVRCTLILEKQTHPIW